MNSLIVCTKDKPWDGKTLAPGVRVQHPDAEYLFDQDFGGGEYCEKYRCPWCGHSFYVELPQ